MGLSQMFQTATKPAHVQQGVMHGTPATRHIHALAIGSTTRRKKGGKKKKAPSATKKSARPATAARSGKAHLVKGSAAAKSHMAKLRKMVGKKKKAA